MRLLKVHVPDFRGLKNVEINFEQDLTPQVFPLGGENGSGKSTLLQLIFTLLHCLDRVSTDPFLWNMIKHMKRSGEKWELRRYDIATLEIFFEEKFIFDEEEHIKFEFFIFPGLDSDEGIFARMYPETSKGKNISLCSTHCFLPVEPDGLYPFFVYVKLSNSDKNLTDIVSIWDVQNRIFIASQATQPYLFLEDENIRELFKIGGNYEKTVEDARKALPNFYTYNNSAIMEILETFKAAFDEDRKQVIVTGGSYGTSFKSLLDEFKQVLGNEKYIFPTPELDGISVRYQTGKDEFIDLGPSDLSHGELKRLSLYSWIRNKKINNSIVLIDEIENGLHPDWQYNIVRDLAEWGDNNQYILATHSFYLCEALTPRHVKTLEPAMKNPVREKN